MNKFLAIRKTIERTRKANLHTAVVLQTCCYIDGLGKKKFNGGSEYRFKKYIQEYMPQTYQEFTKRSEALKKKEDYCLHALWRDVRCGLVHEVDSKSKSVILGRGKTIVHQNVKDKRFKGKDLILSSPRFVDNFLSSLSKI